jgi:hypothetical protein
MSIHNQNITIIHGEIHFVRQNMNALKYIIRQDIAQNKRAITMRPI